MNEEIGMVVHEACDIMTVVNDTWQKTEKNGEFSVYGERIANHLRALQDKYDALLAENSSSVIALQSKIGLG
jgi:hypothetical protein